MQLKDWYESEDWVGNIHFYYYGMCGFEHPTVTVAGLQW